MQYNGFFSAVETFRRYGLRIGTLLAAQRAAQVLWSAPRRALKSWWYRQLFAHLGVAPLIDPSVRIVGPSRISIGNNFYIGWNAQLKCPKDKRGEKLPNLVIGDNVLIRDGVIIDASYLIDIGDHTIVGPYSLLIDNNHNFSDPTRPIREQGNHYRPVRIGRACWLGAHVIVLPGVTIGDHSVIAANATVTKDIPDFSVAAGSPAKVIRHLPTQSTHT